MSPGHALSRFLMLRTVGLELLPLWTGPEALQVMTGYGGEGSPAAVGTEGAVTCGGAWACFPALGLAVI